MSLQRPECTFQVLLPLLQQFLSIAPTNQKGVQIWSQSLTYWRHIQRNAIVLRSVTVNVFACVCWILNFISVTKVVTFLLFKQSAQYHSQQQQPRPISLLPRDPMGVESINCFWLVTQKTLPGKLSDCTIEFKWQMQFHQSVANEHLHLGKKSSKKKSHFSVLLMLFYCSSNVFYALMACHLDFWLKYCHDGRVYN